MTGRSDATGKIWSRGLWMLLAFVLGLSSAPAGRAGNVGDVPSPISPPLQGFQLVAENEGWVLVAQRLYWTVDGGQTWRDITPMALERSTIRGVTFLDTRQGWLVGTRVEESGLLAYVLAHTTDRGVTWRMKPLALFEPGDPNSLAGAVYLHLLDPQTGWLVIKQATGSNFSLGSLFRTSDGGETWTRLTLPIGELVRFATSEIGWAAGGPAGDELYRTQDGGQTWQPQRVGTLSDGTLAQQRLVQLPVFDDPQNGVLPLVSVGGGEAQVEFYITSDGGESWTLATRMPLSQEIAPGIHVPFSVVDAGHWVLSLPNSKQLLHLLDRGETVVVAGQDPLPGTISELDMVTSQIGWATVVFGECHSQPGSDPRSLPKKAADCHLETKLVRTRDGGNTWTALSLPESPSPEAPTSGTAPDSAAEKSGSFEESGSRTELFVGQGFDKCEVPTLSQLQAWMTSSPYDAVNLYIGGSCRGCPNSGLTADFLAQASQQGWKFIPTWVGPQSACWGGSCGTISNDTTTAYNQGVSEADAALAVAINLGLAESDGSGTIIYYNLEGYGGADPTCRNAAKSFINGWTARLRQRGSEAGVYTSSCGGAISDFASIANVPDAIWPAHWIYDYYNPSATVWSVLCLSDGLWANHQRIRQYAGGHNETWGGVTLNTDCNVLDGIVANVGGTCCGCLRATCCSGAQSHANASHCEFRWGDSGLPSSTTLVSCPVSRMGETIDTTEPAALPEEESEITNEPVFWDAELSVTTTASIIELMAISPEGADPIDSPSIASVPAQPAPVEPQRTPLASASYRIPKSVFGSGGGPKTSTHYVMNSTQGQSTDLSRRTSTSYVLTPGYWSRWTPINAQLRVYLPLVMRNH